MNQTSIRQSVFLVDSYPVMLLGIKALLETQRDFVVVGTANDIETAISGIEATQPDIVISEASLPGDAGLMLVERLCHDCPEVMTVVLTSHEEPACVQQMLQAGARGFVLKRSAAETLVPAIRAACAGGIYVDPAIVSKVTWSRTNAFDETQGLSDREEEVLRLVAKGFSNKEISSKFNLSIKTVETYRKRANEKLGLRTRAALVHYAMVEGWMTV